MSKTIKDELIEKLTEEELKRAAYVFELLLKWQKEDENKNERTENCTKK